VDVEYTKEHYYRSQVAVNPTGIIPIGPKPEFDLPHDRARLAAGSLRKAG
jgi:putative glutathione S-transferase